MAQHETELDALFGDGFFDAEVEEGEMTEEEQMDVDILDMDSFGAEEGEVLFDEPPSSAFRAEPAESTAAELAEFHNHPASGESGQSNDLGRPSRQKKRNKKRSGKRAKRVNVAQFVRDTCNHLREKKYPLMWAAVKMLGVDGVRNLIKEVDVIERCGGQMTNDGKRRRTPGGVMWNILRGRVQPALYKEIMSQGNEVQKQKDKKAKDSLKRNRMDVDQPISDKRQKLSAKDEDVSGSGAPGKQTNQSRQVLRPAKDLSDVLDLPQKDNSSLPALHLQKAWVEGIRKKETVDEAAVVSVPPTGADSEILKDGTATARLLKPRPMSRMWRPGEYPASVFERLRVPVGYRDLVAKKKALLLSGEQLAPIGDINPVEGGPGDFGRQDPEQNGE